MRSVVSTLLCIVALWSGSAYAAVDCWQLAGQHYNIDPVLLYAICLQESSHNASLIHYNNDGSYDIGLMQINSSHLPELRTQGITQKKLLNNTCLSIMVAASLLSDYTKRFGRTWEAVGAYNAGTGTSAKRRAERELYAHRVWVRYQQLLKGKHLPDSLKPRSYPVGLYQPKDSSQS